MKTNILTAKQLQTLRIQFLFVTANKYEYSEIRQRMSPVELDTETIFTGKTLTYSIGYLGSYLIAHIHCPQQGAQKPFAATLSINEAYATIKPLCVAMVGIAFGRSDKTQRLGDVLLSQRVRPYNSIRRSTKEDGTPFTEDRNEPVSPGHTLMHLATNFANWINNVSLRYTVHTGTILAGEELIDNDKYKLELISSFESADEDIIGGEMESVGLTSVMIHEENANWIVVKAICDWADGKKKENKSEQQQLAARNAVDFCVRFFKTDSPGNLPGFVKTAKNYEEKNNAIMINGYKMFYARNKLCCTIKSLSKQTKIIEAELRKLEAFKITDGKPVFFSIKPSWAKKIQSALKCGNELFEDAYDAREEHFFQNKDKHNLCPPECAKAVVFDFDGTLTNDGRFSSWQMLWEYLGYDLKLCDALHRKYTNGDINHKEWCDITAEYFIQKNLKKDDIFYVAQRIELLPGAFEILVELKKHNIPVYICSGSIDIIIESVLGDLAVYFKRIASNQFAYDETGTTLKAIIGTKFDFEGKSNFVKRVAVELGIKTSDIVFVGNSNNDEFAVSSGAKTLVVNPILTSGYDRKVWKYFAGTDIKDLRDLLPYLLPDYYILGEDNFDPKQHTEGYSIDGILP